MATTPSFVQINEGTGKKLAHATYTENGQVVYDQKTIPGEPYLPTYTLTGGVSIATSGSHVFQLMAGASLNVRIVRIEVYQALAATTAAGSLFALTRLTSAGTGGTVVTPNPLDTADPAAGATGMTLPTVKGTTGATLYDWILQLSSAAGGQSYPIIWQAPARSKGIVIPAGTSNGVALIGGGNAAASAYFAVTFTEASF